MGIKNLFVQIPEDVHKELKQKALDEGTSIKDIVVNLIRESIKKDYNKEEDIINE